MTDTKGTNMDATKWAALREEAVAKVTEAFDRWEAVADAVDPVTGTFTASIHVEGYGVYTDTVEARNRELFSDDNEDAAAFARALPR